MEGIPSEELAVEAEHRVAGRVKHGGEPNEENFKDARLEERHLVIFSEEGEARESLGKLHHVPNGREETFGKVLEELLLSVGRGWRGIKRAGLLEREQKLYI